MSSFSRSSEEKKPAIDDENAFTPEALQDGEHRSTSVISKTGVVVNASGHKDQLHRQYGLLSICGLALTIDNAWVALGGSLTVSIGMYQ